MALTVGERAVRPLTADEALRMVDAGILRDAERLELLHGVLTQKPVKDPPHEELKTRLLRWLAGAIAAGRYDVRVEAVLVAADGISAPEPDVAVVEPRDAMVAHPTTALLVIEVAASSLRTDVNVKAPLYAAAGVPEYWVADVEHRRLEVFAEPRGADYTRRETREPIGTIAPRAVDVEPLDLAALFAGLA